MLTALSAAQHEALMNEPNPFAVDRDAALAAGPIARRHRNRLRILVERVLDERIGTGSFVARDRERTIASIFDASDRFTHPRAIGHDADLPADFLDARLGAMIQAIQRMLRTDIPSDE